MAEIYTSLGFKIQSNANGDVCLRHHCILLLYLLANGVVNVNITAC